MTRKKNYSNKYKSLTFLYQPIFGKICAKNTNILQHSNPNLKFKSPKIPILVTFQIEQFFEPKHFQNTKNNYSRLENKHVWKIQI